MIVGGQEARGADAFSLQDRLLLEMLLGRAGVRARGQALPLLDERCKRRDLPSTRVRHERLQGARVPSNGSAWLWAFATASATASAQAAEMRPFFAARRAIATDLWSCFITRVTPFLAFRSVSVPETCESNWRAWPIRRFRAPGSRSLPQSGPPMASMAAAQKSPQAEAQGRDESASGAESTQP